MLVSRIQCFVSNSEQPCPFNERQRFAVRGETHRIAAIPHLRCARRPLAVVRFVAFVIVFAFDGVGGARSRPHVGVKVFETTPTLAHRDAAPAVVLPMVGAWVSASAAHVSPNPVLRHVNQSVAEIWHCGTCKLREFDVLLAKLSFQTSATARAPASQSICQHVRNGSAHAHATPSRGTVFGWRKALQRSQPSKLLPAQIKLCGHVKELSTSVNVPPLSMVNR